MKTTDVLPQSASTTDLPPTAASGLLDLRSFIVVAISVAVASVTGLVAAAMTMSHGSTHDGLLGIGVGFVAAVPGFLSTAAGLNSLIQR